MIKPTAYRGLLMLILLSKIEGIYTFNATNLHQNAVKNYLKLSQIQCIILDRSRTVNEPIKVEKINELVRVVLILATLRFFY